MRMVSHRRLHLRRGKEQLVIQPHPCRRHDNPRVRLAWRQRVDRLPMECDRPSVLAVVLSLRCCTRCNRSGVQASQDPLPVVSLVGKGSCTCLTTSADRCHVLRKVQLPQRKVPGSRAPCRPFCFLAATARNLSDLFPSRAAADWMACVLTALARRAEMLPASQAARRSTVSAPHGSPAPLRRSQPVENTSHLSHTSLESMLCPDC